MPEESAVSEEFITSKESAAGLVSALSVILDESVSVESTFLEESAVSVEFPVLEASFISVESDLSQEYAILV